ncbi:MAG TPA: ATP-binding cassette domain-containing protein [Firmicutes bacterium]|nr:ATP-binding cassette domain-containing protein [Bacillota bacterium]
MIFLLSGLTTPESVQADLEQAPETVRDRLQMLAGTKEVIYSVNSDMNLLGTYTDESWLFITEDKLIVFDSGHQDGSLVVHLNQLTGARIRQLYGNSVLELRFMEDAPADMLLQVAQTIDEPDAETEASADLDDVPLTGPSADVFRFSRTLDDQMDEVLQDLTHRLIPTAQDKEVDWQPEADTDLFGSNKRKGICRSCGRVLPPGQSVCPRCMDRRRLLGRAFQYVLPYKWLFIGNFLSTVMVTMLGLVPPLFTTVLLDRVFPNNDMRLLIITLVSLAGVYFFQSLLNSTHIYLQQLLGNRVVVNLRTDVYRHVQRLTLKFYDKRQTGWIMSRVTNDTSYLQSFLVNGLQDIVIQVFTLVGIAVIMFSINWKLALLALLPTPIVSYATTKFSRRMHKVYHRIWRRVSNMHAVLGDTIPGIRVVKAFNREDEEVAKFVEKNEEVFNENIRAARVSSVFFPAMGFTTQLGGLLVWGIGGYQVIQGIGGLSVGVLMAFINYTWRFYAPIQALSRLSEQLQGATTAAERLFEILDTPIEAEDEKGTALPEIKGHIRFEDVSFYYEKGDPVLQRIDLDIQPGEMIGLVGSSGSGKTTLINLIARFYDVSEGRILLDGHDLRDLDLAFLRNHIGMVLQEPFLFHGTIAENIAYGRPEAGLDEIVEAAMMANAHGFIMELPDGYDTRIGERGVGLSGGQKQRISIARAILKNPRILILDEATSAVDTETEKLIQQAIDRLIQGRTTIAIAHRLSTLQNASRLVVLQDGKVAEVGTHEELLQKEDGVFARLVQLQSEVARSRLV